MDCTGHGQDSHYSIVQLKGDTTTYHSLSLGLKATLPMVKLSNEAEARQFHDLSRIYTLIDTSLVQLSVTIPKHFGNTHLH